MKKAVTIAKIAQESGFSVSTVSRVLNKKPDVQPDTRTRILEVIEKYHFHASAYAQSIAQKRTHTIAMVIAERVDYVFMNQYFSELQRGIITTLQKAGYYALSLYCNDVAEALDAYRQQRIDGILLISPTGEQRAVVEEMREEEVPVVIIGSFPFASGVPCVRVDDYGGAVQAMDYLFALGHEKIAYISGPNEIPSSWDRFKAYRDKMAERGLPVSAEMVQRDERDGDSSAAIRAILQAVPEVSAIFAGSDFVAIATINAAMSLGLRVPDDLSVMGFDGVPMSAQMLPKLTTISQDGDKKGCLAAELLVRWLETNEPPQEDVVMEPRLIIRGSVRDLRETRG